MCNFDRVQDIKDAAQSIIDHAESILGNEDYLYDFSITISFSANRPIEINTNKYFYPHRNIEKLI